MAFREEKNNAMFDKVDGMLCTMDKLYIVRNFHRHVYLVAPAAVRLKSRPSHCRSAAINLTSSPAKPINTFREAF